jgi:hypothetical protein
MSSNSIDVNTLVEAVGEDPRLNPFEKETHIGFTKDGSPTTAARTAASGSSATGMSSILSS